MIKYDVLLAICIATMVLSCTVSDMCAEIGRESQSFRSHLFLTP